MYKLRKLTDDLILFTFLCSCICLSPLYTKLLMKRLNKIWKLVMTVLYNYLEKRCSDVFLKHYIAD
jgi:hypothetical protein